MEICSSKNKKKPQKVNLCFKMFKPLALMLIRCSAFVSFVAAKQQLEASFILECRSCVIPAVEGTHCLRPECGNQMHLSIKILLRLSATPSVNTVIGWLVRYAFLRGTTRSGSRRGWRKRAGNIRIGTTLSANHDFRGFCRWRFRYAYQLRVNLKLGLV